jgi:ABC-type sulfate transport system substrate-binding protein
MIGVLSKRRGRALRTPTTPRPASAFASAMTPTVRLSLNYCTAGQKGDAPQAAALIEGLPAEVVMADTAYDADLLRQAIAAKGAIAVIPNNPSRALKYPLDKHL